MSSGNVWKQSGSYFKKIKMAASSIYKTLIDSIRNNDISVHDILSLLNSESCNDKVCIACSGGSDSVYLLDFIFENYKNLRDRIIVLHFNHDIRGQSSYDDEIFVKKLSQQYHVNYYCERLINKPSKITEETLRICRNEFFLRALNKFSSKILILGHHKNDVAETLLMRLSRGSDTSGLSSPHAITLFKDGHVRLRPLLNITKQELQNQLLQKNLTWREDSTNFDNEFFRNKIRNVVIPVYQSASGSHDIINSLSIVKQNIEEADDAISYFSQIFCKNHNMINTVCLKDIIDWPVAVLRRILIEFFTKNNIDVRKSYHSQILEAIKQNKPCKISTGNNTWISYNDLSLHLERKTNAKQTTLEATIGNNTLPDGKTLNISIIDLNEAIWKNVIKCDIKSQCFAKLPNDFKIEIRQISPSQKYIRLGHCHGKKISDLLTSSIIDKENKKSLPMIFINDEICWVPYLPVTDKFQLNQTDKKALLLTYF